MEINNGMVFALLVLSGIVSAQDSCEHAESLNSVLARVDQLEAAVKNHPIELAKVRNKHDEDMAKLRIEFQEYIFSIEARHEKDITQLKRMTGKSPNREQQESYRPVKRNGSIRRGSAKVSSSSTRQLEEGIRTAFFAKLAVNTEHFGFNQPIIFNNVTTNVGNNYDNHVGLFRAPVAGIYIFSTSITSYGSNKGHFGIFINDGRETQFYNNGAENAWDESSQTVIVHLKKGDDVTVRSLDADHAVTGYDYSLFSGVLLFSDTEQTAIVGK